jgi:putative FmdB family regulatory protein
MAVKNRKTGRAHMPLYEYRCQACGDGFETLRRLHDKDEDVMCPKCGEKKAEKLLSACCTVNGKSSSANTTSYGTKGFT